MTKQKILIIDDDEKMNRLLQNYLVGFGYDVVSCTHPTLGLQKIKQYIPDLIILDIMLPDMDGFTVCREVRKELSVPIIMLTARGDVTDRIVGLELGADDYLPKPFEPRELVARIQTIMRRVSTQIKSSGSIKFDHLEIIPEKQMAIVDGETIDITTMEFQLLLLLVEKRGRIITRDQIMDSLRGIDWSAFDRSVDVAVSRLRQKLKDDPKTPRFIKTIWGTGYMFIGYEE
ncbi:MAG: response regulator transcription factor [Bacteroidales bacterium]|nr:response regulator transcription factor [Bacteroidales bacterium]